MKKHTLILMLFLSGLVIANEEAKTEEPAKEVIADPVEVPDEPPKSVEVISGTVVPDPMDLPEEPDIENKEPEDVAVGDHVAGNITWPKLDPIHAYVFTFFACFYDPRKRQD